MIACEFCGLVHGPPLLAPGEKARCARCGAVLARAPRDPIDGTLALALAAAVLLVLANTTDLLRFSLEGQVRENTIASGVAGLWKSGQPLLAGLILFVTIVAPALRILALLYVLLPLRMGRVPPGVAPALRFQAGLVSWAMLDVYMLALLVAVMKLGQMAHVELRVGAYCTVALFLVLTLVNAFYDRGALWERVEELA